MHYEKPTIVNLGAQARPTAGQGPLQCMIGGAASGVDEWCLGGTGASITDPPECGAGSTPGYWCGTGVTPTNNACVSGITVASAFTSCDAGGGADAAGPGICLVGSLPT